MRNENSIYTSMKREALIESYVLKINQMEMSFSDLRKALSIHRFSKEEEDQLVKEIDNRIHKLNASKTNIDFRINKFWLGLIALILGCSTTLGTWLFPIRDRQYFIFDYGLIFYGITTIARSKRRKKRKYTLKSQFRKPGEINYD